MTATAKQLVLFPPPVVPEPAGVAAAARLIKAERLPPDERLVLLGICCRAAIGAER